MNTRKIVSNAGGVILSLFIAFFGVFNVLFSDIFGLGAEMGAVAYIFVLYFVASLILHWRNQTNRLARWILLLPPVLFSLFIAVQDQTRYGYILAVVTAVVFGTLCGRLVRVAIVRRRAALS